MARETLDQIGDAVDGADTTNVLMAARDEDDNAGNPEFEVQKVSMSGDLGARFQWIVQTSITDSATEYRLREYDIEYKLDRDELFYIHLDDVPETAARLSQVENVNQAPVFRRDDGFAERLAFYCITMEQGADNQEDTHQASFYRKHAPKNILTNGLLTRLVEQDYFEELESKTYLFDRQVDFFTFGDYLFVNNAYNFQLVFNRFEQLQQQVEDNVNRVVDRVPIANRDEFLEACKRQPQMVSKIAHVASRPYLEDITFEDIRRTVDEFDLDLEITQDGDGNDQLVFDSNIERRWTILKMLDDDYLGSILTDRRYEANSKVER